MSKTSDTRIVGACVTIVVLCGSALAQVNSWTNPASAAWEGSTNWSLGVLPDSTQSIMITNAGYKAVGISPSTRANYPNSMTVSNLTISAPPNGLSTLLLNYSGTATPLRVLNGCSISTNGSLDNFHGAFEVDSGDWVISNGQFNQEGGTTLATNAMTSVTDGGSMNLTNADVNLGPLSIASNSAMTMLSSALQINGPSDGGMTIGGQFNQTDSTVSGNQINVGYIGPGVYNFNSGLLDVTNLWVGGPYDGIFCQNGGTNAVGTVHLDGTGGEYVLSNGVYNATTYFDGGTFLQEGGQLNSEVYVFQGNYVLARGTLEGNVTVPGTNGFSPGNGAVLQTGGTVYGSIDVGTYGAGTYTFSNGFATGNNFYVDYNGTFTQWGGTIVYPYIYIDYSPVSSNSNQFGTLVLNGGQMQAYYSITIYGNYVQTGGTNVTDDVLDFGGSFSLSGGLFEAYYIEGGDIFLSGGTMLVSDIDDFGNFYMSGGQLIVTNITVSPAASLSCTGGTVSQWGSLLLMSANLLVGSTTQSFGPLQVGFAPGYSYTNNSMLVMSAGTGIVRFGDSSGFAWSGGLNVSNWNGSLTGGGKQQIIFGNSAGALTAQQLSLIQFQNPAGFAPGNYPARILPDGEIVPVAATLGLSLQANGIQLTVQGRTGSNYNIEASTDLLHWAELIDELDTNGTLTFTDTNAPNFPHRFYRAALVP